MTSHQLDSHRVTFVIYLVFTIPTGRCICRLPPPTFWFIIIISIIIIIILAYIRPTAGHWLWRFSLNDGFSGCYATSILSILSNKTTRYNKINAFIKYFFIILFVITYIKKWYKSIKSFLLYT